MKPIYLKKYQQHSDASFLVKYAEVPHTYDRFHYHNEYELIYHIQNRGARFVGDSIQRFDNGDLVLVGPNTPHYWHSDDIYFKGDKNVVAKVVLIQFSKDFLGKDFFNLPEMHSVKKLLDKATRGIQVFGKDRKRIANLIMALPSAQKWEQLLKLINILCVLSEAENMNLLASPGFNQSAWMRDENKISQIFDFILKNYQNEINLNEVADYANMNKSAFCRYFKKTAKKTFSQVLNEIRIGFACKEMIYSDKTIAEIAFDCGYANVTYFNKVFKLSKNRTPQQYRKQYSGGIESDVSEKE